jgi:ABC-type transport system substrate-binding protein/uncharacterized ubiquitin-like protein YukD
MAKLRVTIIDEVRNRRLKVDLPDDAAMEKLLPALAKKLGLPTTDSGGQTIAYQLTHEATEQVLSREQTLASFGVREGDVLRLATVREEAPVVPWLAEEEAIPLRQKVAVWVWVGIVVIALLAVAALAFWDDIWPGLKPTPTVVAEVTTPPATSTATPRPTATPVTPTDTPALAEPTPTTTSLPGMEMIPLANLATSIPWLPLDENAVPGVYYYGFNVAKPPFDNRLVRQAFALTVERQMIANLANSLGSTQARPATTFTPPDVLGRDLYEQVGLPFDPAKARELLAEAGYPNGEGFPQVTLVFNYKEAHEAIASAVVAMWRDHLGVNVGLESVDDWDAYLERLDTDAPAIFRFGWAADYNDPDNFLVPSFHSDGDNNRTHFANAEFNNLVEQAAVAANDPARRQVLYIQAERILCEQEAAIIPIYHSYYKEQ